MESQGFKRLPRHTFRLRFLGYAVNLSWTAENLLLSDETILPYTIALSYLVLLLYTYSNIKTIYLTLVCTPILFVCLSLNLRLGQLMGSASLPIFNGKRSRRFWLCLMNDVAKWNLAQTYFDVAPADGLLFLWPLGGRAVLNLTALIALFPTLVCWVFQPRRLSSMSLTASHCRLILASHTTFTANIRRTATSKNSFVTLAFNLISLTSRSMVLAEPFASKRLLPRCRAVPRYFARIGTPNSSVSPNRLRMRPKPAPILWRFRSRISHSMGCANSFPRLVRVIFMACHLALQSWSQRKKTNSIFCTSFPSFSFSNTALSRPRRIRVCLRLIVVCWLGRLLLLRFVVVWGGRCHFAVSGGV